MPNSTNEGSRPIRSRIFWYSASDRPCSLTMAGVILVMVCSRKGFDQALEKPAAVGAAQHIVHHPLGMGHQAQHIALFAEDAGDVAGRAVGVLTLGVTEGDAVFAF